MGLKYRLEMTKFDAAAVSLAEIGTPEAIAALQQALAPESDCVVQTRIRMALNEGLRARGYGNSKFKIHRSGVTGH
jgi:PBS lyase HEAT-like repeat